MKNEQQTRLQAIIDKALPYLLSGETTLEDVLSAYPQDADQLRPYLESALWLSAHKAGLEPRAGYITDSKQRLVNSINTNHSPTRWERFWQKGSPQRLTIQALSFFILLISLVSVANTLISASRIALPGDWLYPTKLSIEQVQLGLTVDSQAQARLQIELTKRRTTEVIQLVLEDDYAHLPETVDRLEAQLDQAVSDLHTARAEDGIQAEALAETMKEMLKDEAFILTLLRDMQPILSYVGLNRAIAVTITSMTALQN